MQTEQEELTLTEKEKRLILFIREHGFGVMTLEFQHGEPTIIREPIVTTKL